MRFAPATTNLHGYGETRRVPDHRTRTPHTRVSPEEQKTKGHPFVKLRSAGNETAGLRNKEKKNDIALQEKGMERISNIEFSNNEYQSVEVKSYQNIEINVPTA